MRVRMLPMKMLPAALAPLLLALPAAAVPVTLDLDAAGGGVNQADFTVTVSPFNVSDSVDADGSLALDVGFDGTTPDAIRFLPGTDVGFTDVLISVFGQTVAQTTGVRGTITSPALDVLPDGSVDLGGSVLTLDEGTVNVIGDDPANNDLAGNPIVLTLPAGSVAGLAATDLGGGQIGLVLSGPIAFGGQVDDDPVITLSVTGNLTARGVALVPEPAAAGLLALAGLVALRRRSSR